MATQLILPVGLKDFARFKNFYAGKNQQLIEALHDICLQNIFIVGANATGKSHLLQASCHVVKQQHLNAIYLPLAELLPEILDGLDEFDLIAIDDLDKVLPDKVWEEKLFVALNLYQKSRFIIAANTAPQQLDGLLPDLQSRLVQFLIFQIAALNDEEKQQALQLHARNRGLELGEEVSGFLLRRYPRDMRALFIILEQLDQASLQNKRRLTVPFVKSVLEI